MHGIANCVRKHSLRVEEQSPYRLGTESSKRICPEGIDSYVVISLGACRIVFPVILLFVNQFLAVVRQK